MSTKAVSLFDREIMSKAVIDSFKKLDPRQQLKNPVMFITLLGAISIQSEKRTLVNRLDKKTEVLVRNLSTAVGVAAYAALATLGFPGLD